MELLRGLITAIRTLTTLRVPGKDAKEFSTSLYFFPFVGGLVGIAVGASVYLLDRYLGWREIAAAAGLLVSVRMTGCLHMDGLADVCDSFGGHSREKKLAIMKDSSVGVFGVVGVVLCLLVKYLCLLRLDSFTPLLVIPAAFAISRASQVGVMVGLPYARVEGTAGSFVENAALRHLISAVVLALALAWFMACQAGLVLAAAAMVVTVALRIWAKRTLGGVTGDVIGFTNEIVETVCLLAAAILLG